MVEVFSWKKYSSLTNSIIEKICSKIYPVYINGTLILPFIDYCNDMSKPQNNEVDLAKFNKVKSMYKDIVYSNGKHEEYYYSSEMIDCLRYYYTDILLLNIILSMRLRDKKGSENLMYPILIKPGVPLIQREIINNNLKAESIFLNKYNLKCKVFPTSEETKNIFTTLGKPELFGVKESGSTLGFESLSILYSIIPDMDLQLFDRYFDSLLNSSESDKEYLMKELITIRLLSENIFIYPV